MKLTPELIELMRSYETPFLLLDVSKIEANYRLYKENIHRCDLYYAVKANSEERIIKRLAQLGSSFDCASVNEMKLVLKYVTPDRVSFGNTIKKAKDIVWAYQKGIRLFVADAMNEVLKLSQHAPGANVYIRLEMTDHDADWPLTRKFGATMEDCVHLALKVKELGLVPYGISFHVGSQCYNKYIWKEALLKTSDVFRNLKKHDITLQMVNLGGGFPVQHLKEIPEALDIINIINQSVQDYFGGYPQLRIFVEPGRSLVGDAGVLVGEVILTTVRLKEAWVYTDIGVFHGLMESIENFGYEILTEKENDPKIEYTIAGPSCDSVDIMYEQYLLPETLSEKDRLYFMNAGAYTIAYSTHFNGIEPPKIYYK